MGAVHGTPEKGDADGEQHVVDTTGTEGEEEEVRTLLATSRRSHASHQASYTRSVLRAQPQG